MPWRSAAIKIPDVRLRADSFYAAKLYPGLSGNPLRRGLAGKFDLYGFGGCSVNFPVMCAGICEKMKDLHRWPELCLL